MVIWKQKFVSFVVGMAMAVVVASPVTGQAGDCPRADVAHFKTELLQLRSEYMAIADTTKNEPMRGNEIFVLSEIEKTLDQVDFVVRMFDLISRYCLVETKLKNREIWREVVISFNGALRTIHEGNKSSYYMLIISVKESNRYANIVDKLAAILGQFDKSTPREIS